MASISSSKVEDLFIPVHDGTTLVLRKIWGGRGRAVLIIPGKGERIAEAFYDDLAQSVVDEHTTAYLLELRGHGVSEGTWSLGSHRKDIEHVLEMIHKAFHTVFVIANDWSAGVMLEREHQGQHIDGMILLEPRLEQDTPKIRAQTPAIVLTAHPAIKLVHAVSGSVEIRSTWHVPKTALERTAQIRQLKDALRHLATQEKPIRFSLKR